MPSVALDAQTVSSTLRGTVKDEQGQPIELAAVVLNRALGTSTRRDGSFTLTNIPRGSYQWEVSYVGYETARGTLVIKTGRERLDVVLKELNLGLKEVMVTARQNQMGSISEIGQEAIRHLQPKSVGDMLQLMPGNLTETPV